MALKRAGGGYDNIPDRQIREEIQREPLPPLQHQQQLKERKANERRLECKTGAFSVLFYKSSSRNIFFLLFCVS